MSDKENLTDEFDALFDETEKAADKVSDVVDGAADSAEDFVTSIDQNVSSAQDALETAADEVVSQEAAQDVKNLVDDTRISDEFDEIDFDDLDQIISLENADEAPVFSDAADAVNDTAEEAAEEIKAEVEDDVIAEAGAFAGTFADEAEEAVETVKEQAVSEAEDDFIDPETDPNFDRRHKKEAEEADLLDEDEEEKAKALSKDQLKKENRNFWIFTSLIALVVAGAVLFILYSRGLIFNDDTGESSGVIVTTPEDTTTEAASESEEAMTSEEPSSESTEEITSSSEEEQSSEEDTSSSEETPSSEEESSSDEESSPSESESTGESESQSGGEGDIGDASKVVESYTKLFIVKGTDMVNLRREPSTESDVLAKIPEFGGGELLEELDGWYRVNSGGFLGYVSSDYAVQGEEAEALAKDNARYMVRVEADLLNMREGPGTEYGVLEPVQMGTLWDYLGEEGDFYHVKYLLGMEGYLSKDPQHSTVGWFVKEASKYYTED